MEKKTICFIDDDFSRSWGHSGFPVGGMLTDSEIRYCLDKYPLNDLSLYSLLKSSLDNSDFSVSAYASPDFFLNEEIFHPNYIVYDWDYGISTKESSEWLKILCEKYFCFIFIFTCYDNITEINQKIEHEFIDYKNRISIFSKEDDSIEKIKQKIELCSAQNFSFKFCTNLRKYSWQGLESILIELAKYDLNVVINSLTDNGENEENLIDFIGEKYKAILRDTIEFLESSQNEEESSSASPENTDKGLELLWEYRLTTCLKTKQVKKGDILNVGNDHWLIVTPNCELHSFWKKTFGYLNYYKLYEINENKEEIKEHYKSANDKETIDCNKKITSLTNPITNATSAPFFLPFVHGKAFLLFPKEIFSKKISKPENFNQEDPSLKLSDIPNSKRIANLNNPFLSELIEQCFMRLKGFGVPDYDKQMIEDLANQVKKVTE
ncbi:MAG: hypothetical protein J6T84_01915 [Spirochaetaceae bacterium]|nr:hypothetical protein [Spirochaetaceae bacterium]